MRVSEWVIAVFFAWTTALALSLSISGHMRTRTLLANAAVLLAYIALTPTATTRVGTDGSRLVSAGANDTSLQADGLVRP